MPTAHSESSLPERHVDSGNVYGLLTHRLVIRFAGATACRIACTALRPVARLAGALSGSRVVASVATRGLHVALTIDDGPHPATTPELLCVLRNHGARATFFLIGERAQSYPDLVRRIAADGHELANHLMHDEPSIRLPAIEFRRQLTQVHELLVPCGDVVFFRPGSGWFTTRMLREAAAQGYACAMGTPLLLLTRHRNPRDSGRVLARRAHPGAVIVLHEGDESRAAVSATADTMLDELAKRNLRAITLSELATRAGW